jgi:SAM-dependent methyltransferase
MKIFGNYATYYNLLYKDKDYAGEAQYVHNLIQKYLAGAKSILNLGCGSGRHDFKLARMGYEMTGVDMSDEMLSVANLNLAALNQPSTNMFTKGDIRTVRLNKKFDAVISLFHVMSYQITNEDLAAAFATVKTHLKPEGIFIFDCWYGPAVLTDRPMVRVKRLEDEEIEVTRIAEPDMHANENTVDVNYHIFMRDKVSGKVEETKERHSMRFLFKPEIEMMLKAADLELNHCEEWLTGMTPGFGTWSAAFIVKHRPLS